MNLPMKILKRFMKEILRSFGINIRPEIAIGNLFNAPTILQEKERSINI